MGQPIGTKICRSVTLRASLTTPRQFPGTMFSLSVTSASLSATSAQINPLNLPSHATDLQYARDSQKTRRLDRGLDFSGIEDLHYARDLREETIRIEGEANFQRELNSKKLDVLFALMKKENKDEFDKETLVELKE